MESLFADTWIAEAGGLFIGFSLVVLVPLVVIFLHHQRHMASIYHRKTSSPDEQNRIDHLESEVRELKERINHLIIAQDGVRPLREFDEPPSIADRLRTGS